MRKLLRASAAAAALLMPFAVNAADLGVRPMPAAPAPYYAPQYFSWTGFYIGANVGGAWADGTLSDTVLGFNSSTSQSGVIGGGQVGVNYQMGNFVIGAEGMFDWTSLSANTATIAAPPFAFQGTANTQWVSTLAARFGFAADHWLIYGKAGGAWVGHTATANNLTTGASFSTSGTATGWVLGAGVEYAFTPNWTARLEYDYLGLQNWSTSGLVPGDTFTLNRNIQMLTVGLNYKFGWGAPVSARY